MNVNTILNDVLGGARLTENEAAFLFNVKNRDIWKIAEAADIIRERKNGNVVTYVRNMNIHMTNICKNCCGLCAFGRKSTDPEAFCFTDEEFREHTKKAAANKVTEVSYLSGIHPAFTVESYEKMIRTFHEEIPGIHVHGCSPDEILYAANQSGISTKEALIRLKAAGLDSIPGTAAEILVDRVRNIICDKKLSTLEWVRIIKEASDVGFRATATIMYGSVETAEDRARHLSVLRDIQDECGVFTELVPLSFLHKNTPLERAGIVNHDATGRDDILLIAISRLFLDNFDNIQVPWSKVGRKITQLSLLAGGNDVGGTMFVDALSTDAGGGDESDYFGPEEMELMCTDIGRTLRQRDTLYNLL